MTDRIRLDDMTDDALDALYSRLAKAERGVAEYERVCASVTAGEPLGRSWTVSDVLVQHEVTRKEVAKALDVGLHLNWAQLIEAAQGSHRANGEWQADARRAEAAIIRALAECDVLDGDVHSMDPFALAGRRDAVVRIRAVLTKPGERP